MFVVGEVREYGLCNIADVGERRYVVVGDDRGSGGSGATGGLNPGIEWGGTREGSKINRPKVGEHQSQNNNARVNSIYARKRDEMERSIKGKGLLGHDQRSCKHTPVALSSLVVMFACMVTLVLEPLRDLLTLLVLLVFTLRSSGIKTAQQLIIKIVNKKIHLEG